MKVPARRFHTPLRDVRSPYAAELRRVARSPTLTHSLENKMRTNVKFTKHLTIREITSQHYGDATGNWTV